MENSEIKQALTKINEMAQLIEKDSLRESIGHECSAIEEAVEYLEGTVELCKSENKGHEERVNKLLKEIENLQEEREKIKKTDYLSVISTGTITDVMKNKILLNLSKNLNLSQLEEIEKEVIKTHKNYLSY